MAASVPWGLGRRGSEPATRASGRGGCGRLAAGVGGAGQGSAPGPFPLRRRAGHRAQLPAERGGAGSPGPRLDGVPNAELC